MSKEIRMSNINKIIQCLPKLYELGNDGHITKRDVENAKEIKHYLKDYSKNEQYELIKIINWSNGNIVSDLEKHGWKVIREEK